MTLGILDGGGMESKLKVRRSRILRQSPNPHLCGPEGHLIGSMKSPEDIFFSYSFSFMGLMGFFCEWGVFVFFFLVPSSNVAASPMSSSQSIYTQPRR